MKHKWITLIVIIIVIAGIFGYFLLSQKKPTQTILPAILPTVSPTSTAPSETYGLSEYTDQTYGFSFWYPSALPVMATTTNNNSDFPGGVTVKILQVGPAGGVTIYVVNSPTSSITDEPADHASPIAQTQYFYDKASGQWMLNYPQGMSAGISTAPTTANVSKTTMSGLVMLPSGRRFDTTIIPLSTTRFLVIGDGGGSSFTAQLAETISLTGDSVSPSVLSTILEVEANNYTDTTTKPQACSQTAKECPDGSYVGPTGPNCTFLCPISATSTSTNFSASPISGSTTVAVNSPSTVSNIQQLNAPGSISLPQDGIAEIRNENFYFTSQSLSSSSVTIQITPVGCWNSFPSDTPPKLRCMIAVVPIPPQTLSVGQTYSSANYSITLTKISAALATFLVNASSTVQ